MNTRLQQFLDAENLTQAQFAESIGVVPASVSNVLSGKNRPGWDFTVNMLKRYPDLNPDWFLLGKGKMYRNSSSAAAEQNNNQNNPPRYEDAAETDGKEAMPELFVPADTEIPYSGDTENSARAEMQARTPLSETVTSGALQQITVKQRKAVKIAIFFDDGTFQEF